MPRRTRRRGVDPTVNGDSPVVATQLGPQPDVMNTLEDIPDMVFRIMIKQHLCNLDLKALRSVSKRCRSLIDDNTTALTPRDFPDSEYWAVLGRFRDLDSLVLTQPPFLWGHGAFWHARDLAIEQLTALTGLKSLKVDKDFKLGIFSKVISEGELTGLTTLHYTNAKALVDKDLEGLSCMVNLRELSLSGANDETGTAEKVEGITGEGLTCLTRLSNLRSLDVSDWRSMTEGGLQALAQLSQLTALNANYIKLGFDRSRGAQCMHLVPAIQRHLLRLTGLQRLELGSRKIKPHQELLDGLAGLSRLTALNMNSVCWEEVHIEGSALLNLPELKELRADGWLIHFDSQSASSSDSAVASLALTDLSTWSWKHHSNLNLLLHASLRGGTLKALQLTGSRHSDDSESSEDSEDPEGSPLHGDISDLWTQASTLTCLRFKGCVAAELAVVQRLPNLRSLCFEECDFGHLEDLGHLSGLTALEVLRFDDEMDPRWNDDVLLTELSRLTAVLKRMKLLKSLKIPLSHSITKGLMRTVARLSALEDLDLSNDERGDYDYHCDLAALTQLTSLGLGRMRMGVGNKELGAVRHLVHLRKLKLDGGEFNNSGLRVLTSLTALRSLSLRSCDNITVDGLKAVVLPLSLHFLANVDVCQSSNLTPISEADQAYGIMGETCCRIHNWPTKSIRSFKHTLGKV